MNTETFSVSYSKNSTTSDNLWLNMEQRNYGQADKLTLANIREMVYMALSGLSARKYLHADCPVSFTVDDDTDKLLVAIDFWVYTPEGMQYNLETNIGTITEGIHDFVDKEFSFVVPISDSFEFDYRITDYDFNWEDTQFLANGVALPYDVPYTVDENVIQFSEEIFGVMRFTGKAIATKYTLEMLFEISTEEQISNLKPVIVASWIGSDDKVQTKSLNIDVPECVYTAFATCENDGTKVIVNVNGDKKAGTVTVIWYSTCTGKVLKIVHEEGKRLSDQSI